MKQLLHNPNKSARKLDLITLSKQKIIEKIRSQYARKICLPKQTTGEKIHGDEDGCSCFLLEEKAGLCLSNTMRRM